MAAIRVFLSGTFDPWFNIATEEWIFRDLDPSGQTLFLWRNKPTVVIGRNQNPWSECNLSKMEQDGVSLARRSSGGGAVYQDLGNTNFTFLSPRENYDRTANSNIVIRALASLGVPVESSGRNDLVVHQDDGPRKVSGAAFRETRDRAFHHGTLLLNTDLDCLAQYLTPHPKKLQSKGRASVRARVMNLNEINQEINYPTLAEVLIAEFKRTYQCDCEVVTLDPKSLQALDALKLNYQHFSSWEWRYGHAPKFAQQMQEYLSWGLIDLHFNSDRGRIEQLKIYSDALNPDLVASLEINFLGKTLNRGGIAEAIVLTENAFPDHASDLAEMQTWLEREVELQE